MYFVTHAHAVLAERAGDFGGVEVLREVERIVRALGLLRVRHQPGDLHLLHGLLAGEANAQRLARSRAALLRSR